MTNFVRWVKYLLLKHFHAFQCHDFILEPILLTSFFFQRTLSSFSFLLIFLSVSNFDISFSTAGSRLTAIWKVSKKNHSLDFNNKHSNLGNNRQPTDFWNFKDRFWKNVKKNLKFKYIYLIPILHMLSKYMLKNMYVQLLLSK